MMQLPDEVLKQLLKEEQQRAHTERYVIGANPGWRVEQNGLKYDVAFFVVQVDAKGLTMVPIIALKGELAQGSGKLLSPSDM